MVYCEQDMCESKLGRLMQAFRADRPSEWQMDEFIGMAEQMHKEIEILLKAEKDAARYRSAVSILGEASEMLQLLSLSVSKVSERNAERIDDVLCEIDAELSQCNK